MEEEEEERLLPKPLLLLLLPPLMLPCWGLGVREPLEPEEEALVCSSAGEKTNNS